MYFFPTNVKVKEEISSLKEMTIYLYLYYTLIRLFLTSNHKPTEGNFTNHAYLSAIFDLIQNNISKNSSLIKGSKKNEWNPC